MSLPNLRLLLCATGGALVLLLFTSRLEAAPGGCGSVCLPLDSIHPEKTQLPSGKLRVSVTTEWANFNHFREGQDSVPNTGGNKAKISHTTLFVEYGLNERWTVSALVPYVIKRQKTHKFGKRVADGIGDPSLFARYELMRPVLEGGSSIALGLGLKLPLGSISEPSSHDRLPPAFQVGSGAFDLIPTLSYYHDLEPFALFASAFMRIPLEENRRDYKFGREYNVSGGAEYRLPYWDRKVSLLLSLSYLYAEHDRDGGANLPPKVRSGRKVLNTGGQFLDIVPGIRVHHGRFASQLRLFLPVIENWNGRRSLNVGQVAPDWSLQATLIFAF